MSDATSSARLTIVAILAISAVSQAAGTARPAPQLEADKVRIIEDQAMIESLAKQNRDLRALLAQAKSQIAAMQVHFVQPTSGGDVEMPPESQQHFFNGIPYYLTPMGQP